MHLQQHIRRRGAALALLMGSFLLVAACGRNSSLGLLPEGSADGAPGTATFTVRDRAGFPVAGALSRPDPAALHELLPS